MSFNASSSRHFGSFTEPVRPYVFASVQSPNSRHMPAVRGQDHGNLLLRETANSITRLPLDVRFAKLNQILSTNDPRELQDVFPACVEAVFGYRNAANVQMPQQQPDPAVQWNTPIHQTYIPVSFCEITVNYRLVYEAGYELLQPDGPLFRFIASVSNTRSGQHTPRFAFPVACLPYSVQQSFENGFVAPWYRDKINLDFSEAEGLPESISLNAFDFYFAHFAYHLINPDVRTNSDADSTCLYMALLDVYCSTFFNPKAIVANQNVGPGYGYVGQRRSLNVARSLAPVNDLTGIDAADTPPKINPLATSESLESLINMFVEFWLNMSGPGPKRGSRKYPRASLAAERGRRSPTSYASPLSSPGGRRKAHSSPAMPTVFPPTSALQAFRQVVKALHEFIFAQTVETAARSPRKNPESSLLEMKRHIIPQLIQRPLYELLKDSIMKYPMDVTFKYVYELWLTYLRPWKYEASSDLSKGDDYTVMPQDPRWTGFMSDNLLFFSSLLQKFLERMLRVDFSVPFNTLAVARVAKVFWDTGICARLLAVESTISGPAKAPSASTAFLPNKSTIRNHLADLEGQAYVYNPVRSPENVAMAKSLLALLHRKQVSSQRKLGELTTPVARPLPSTDRLQKLGVDILKCIFGLVASPLVGMQLKPFELERMSKNLSKAIECLGSMYDVLPEDYSANDSTIVTQFNNSTSLDQNRLTDSSALDHSRLGRRHSVPKLVDEEKLPFLTEPERRAAKSWEIQSLIILLNELSDRINEMYGDEIVDCYNGTDFVSRLLHPLIEAPHRPFGITSDDASRRELPARVSLRPLASKYKIAAFLFVLFFMWLFDFGFLWSLFCLIVIPAFFLTANAICEPFRQQGNRN